MARARLTEGFRRPAARMRELLFGNPLDEDKFWIPERSNSICSATLDPTERYHSSGVGTPERLIDELVRQGKRGLTVIANDTAMPGRGIGKLVSAGLVGRTVASHIGLNPETQQQMIAGKMAVDLIPQGTLIERIVRAASGLGGILTPTGAGTVVEESKRRIDVDGKSYLLETALRADFALVHAFLADYLGNLSYALTARNFNPVIAMAGNKVIVTAEHIVPGGSLPPTM